MTDLELDKRIAQEIAQACKHAQDYASETGYRYCVYLFRGNYYSEMYTRTSMVNRYIVAVTVQGSDLINAF